MDHSDEVCGLRARVAEQGAEIRAMQNAVPLALAAKEAEAKASTAIERANMAIAARSGDRIGFYIHLIVTVGLALYLAFHGR